jgi:hypothetical protein
MVNLTAIALAGTLFHVTDFQGHVLDEAFGFLADFNPVSGQVKGDNNGIQQASNDSTYTYSDLI